MAKGYTKFDNDYLLHLSKFDLKGSEFRVLLFLIRQSACYKRQYTKDCSYSFIANGTGLSEASVKRAIKRLISEGYIEICNEATNRSAYTYQLRVVKLGFLGGQTWMFRVVNSDQSRVSNVTTKENTEDNSKKKKEKREASPSFFPNYSIDDYSGAEAKAWKDVLSEEDFQKWLGGYVWD